MIALDWKGVSGYGKYNSAKGQERTCLISHTSFAGIDLQGKQIFRSRTFTPKDGMSARQIEKALTKEALSFEEEVRRGGLSSPDMTVDEFLQKWLNEYAIKQLKIKTVKEYQGLLPRISAALGHIKLSKLTPGHIMQFYDQLAQQGIRLDAKYKARQLLIESCPKAKENYWHKSRNL